MPELVIGLCTHGDTLRVARLQAINTWETRACLPPLDEGLVHAVVGACTAQAPTGVSTRIHPGADAHGEPAPGRSRHMDGNEAPQEEKHITWLCRPLPWPSCCSLRAPGRPLPAVLLSMRPLADESREMLGVTAKLR